MRHVKGYADSIFENDFNKFDDWKAVVGNDLIVIFHK